MQQMIHIYINFFSQWKSLKIIMKNPPELGDPYLYKLELPPHHTKDCKLLKFIADLKKHYIEDVKALAF